MVDKFVTFSLLAIWAIVIFQLFYMYYMAKVVGEFMNRFKFSADKFRNSFQPGDRAPFFRMKDNNHSIVKLNDEIKTQSILLFTSNSCDTCKEILENINTVTKFTSNYRLIVFGERLPTNDKMTNVHFVENRNIMELYEISSVPYLIITNDANRILKASNVNSLQELIQHIKTFSHEILSGQEFEVLS